MQVTPNEQLRVMVASADRLSALIESLTPEELRRQAYPSQWTIADVLSHLGSGAVITRQRIDTEEVGMQAIWDEWNAKSPEEQAFDALQADRALLDRVASLTADDEDKLRFAVGPMDLDLSGFLGMRLNEHVLHTWDVAVTLDETATVPTDAAELVVDTLGMTARFAGKPTGADRTITVLTLAPTRHVEVSLRPDGVTLVPADPADGADPADLADLAETADQADLVMPAEALIRLVYGRLDPDHTPSIQGSEADLDELRRSFPGF
jgi:uncharacterized protein (TIGR03083 family)